MWIYTYESLPSRGTPSRTRKPPGFWEDAEQQAMQQAILQVHQTSTNIPPPAPSFFKGIQEGCANGDRPDTQNDSSSSAAFPLNRLLRAPYTAPEPSRQK